MKYKLPDLKEDIKKGIFDYFETKTPALPYEEEVEIINHLCNIVDKHFEKITSMD